MVGGRAATRRQVGGEEAGVLGGEAGGVRGGAAETEEVMRERPSHERHVAHPMAQKSSDAKG